MGILVWALSIFAGLAFLASGGAKLVGPAPVVMMFGKIGFGSWFRYLTGVLEILGAIALFLPRFRFSGASLLGAVMIGAIGFHLMLLGGNPIGAIVMLLVVGTIAWLSRPQQV